MGSLGEHLQMHFFLGVSVGSSTNSPLPVFSNVCVHQGTICLPDYSTALGCICICIVKHVSEAKNPVFPAPSHIQLSIQPTVYTYSATRAFIDHSQIASAFHTKFHHSVGELPSLNLTYDLPQQIPDPMAMSG